MTKKADPNDFATCVLYGYLSLRRKSEDGSATGIINKIGKSVDKIFRVNNLDTYTERIAVMFTLLGKDVRRFMINNELDQTKFLTSMFVEFELIVKTIRDLEDKDETSTNDN